MAAKIFYITDTTAPDGGSYGTLTTVDPGELIVTISTGWTVAKTAAGRYSLMAYGSERASNTFGTTALPNAGPSGSDCWRTTSPISGTFTSGSWTFLFDLRAIDATGTQDGRMRVRVWKGSAADGSNAVEMTAGTTQLSIVTNLANFAQQSSGTVSVTSNLTLTDEYLFVQCAWEITGAGGNNSCDVLLLKGSDSVTTTNFSGNYSSTVDDTAVAVTDSGTREVTFERGANESVSATDQATSEVISSGLTISREHDETAVTVTDAGTREVQFERLPSDAATVPDEGTREIFFERTPNDSVSIFDQATREAFFARSNEDAISVSDSATSELSTGGSTISREHDDAVDVTDSPSREVQFARGSDDAVSATDASLRESVFERGQTDAVSVADAGSREATFERNAQDAATVTDASTKELVFERGASDSASVTDAGTREASYNRIVEEAVFVEDDFDAALSGVVSVTVSDSASVADEASRVCDASRFLSDSASAADEGGRGIDFGRAANDTAAAADESSRVCDASRICDDGAAATDFAERSGVWVRTAEGDLVSVTDEAAAETSTAPSVFATDLPRTGRVSAAHAVRDQGAAAKVAGATTRRRIGNP
jgi:hypothetical protein